MCNGCLCVMCQLLSFGECTACVAWHGMEWCSVAWHGVGWGGVGIVVLV